MASTELVAGYNQTNKIKKNKTIYLFIHSIYKEKDSVYAFADSRHSILMDVLYTHSYMFRQGQICIHDFTQKPEPKVWSENDGIVYLGFLGF